MSPRPTPASRGIVRQLLADEVTDRVKELLSSYLDRNGEWLYFGALNSGTLYRIRTVDIERFLKWPLELAARIEKYAEITLSDGITSDLRGNIYLTDIEHSALVRVSPTRDLETLIKDKRIRWPDGFSFGPDGWLYVTGSALNDVLGRPKWCIKAHGPYPIYRFRPGEEGIPGHLFCALYGLLSPRREVSRGTCLA